MTHLHPELRARRPGGLWPAACLLAFCLPAAMISTAAAQPAALEQDVKATLLFNFSQFVEWPPAVLPAADQPFVIGILGADPFGNSLDEVVNNERAHGRPIEIRRFRAVEDVDAHILFISSSERDRLDAILISLEGKPVLTVSEIETRAFIRSGGMVAFVNERKTVRLRVNLDAVRSSGLVISAKVLQLAEIVGKGDE